MQVADGDDPRRRGVRWGDLAPDAADRKQRDGYGARFLDGGLPRAFSSTKFAVI